METIAAINSAVNNFVWGVPAMVCIIGVGLWLSFRTNFIQIRRFGTSMRETFGRMFHRTDAAQGAVTPFQAVWLYSQVPTSLLVSMESWKNRAV